MTATSGRGLTRWRSLVGLPALVGLPSRAIVLALLLLGTALRLHDIGVTPPGLYHDEAQHGLDALAVLDGDLSLYFEANNGREPLYIYLVTAAVAILGRTPMAIRLPACFVGILTLAATYDLARSLWNRKVARWALAILAVTFWHVHLSRVGYRAVLLPLFTALTISQAAKGVRANSRRHWITAGVVYGAGWYTYMAARLTPIAIAAVIVYAALAHRSRAKAHWCNALWAALAALVVLLPLGVFTLIQPDVVLTRTGQVSVFSESIHHGLFWRTLGAHTLKTLGVFTVRGDRIWRHNLAWRPVWGPALGLAFVMGLGATLATFRRDARSATVLIWTAVMALPTMLAEDAPHFLRGVGVLPTAALLPAVGLHWLSARLRDWGGPRPSRGSTAAIAITIPTLLWVGGLSSTVYDYFVRYRQAPQTYHWLEGGPVALAGQINAYRGEGWDGTRMLGAPDSGAGVYIDPGLWTSWTALPYLVPESTVTVLPVADVPTDRSLFVVWPYQEWEPLVLPHLTHPAYLQAVPGPKAQGDLDPEPFTIATLIQSEPRPAVPDPVARFGPSIVLRAALVRPTATGADALLWWETQVEVADNLTVFVHYERDGVRIAQHDGPPGQGHLPTTLWLTGDLILDQHPLPDVIPIPDRDTLRIGLYDAASGQGVDVRNPDGSVQGDAIVIPVVLVTP